jgi:hypothetical protein
MHDALMQRSSSESSLAVLLWAAQSVASSTKKAVNSATQRTKVPYSLGSQSHFRLWCAGLADGCTCQSTAGVSLDAGRVGEGHSD